MTAALETERRAQLAILSGLNIFKRSRILRPLD
jgi:hypothetical protein